MRAHRPSITPRVGLVVSMALAMLVASSMVVAQPAQKVFRVGFLAVGGRTPDGAAPAAFRESLARLGYVEGKNITYEARFAEGMHEGLPRLAAELVQLKVDVIAANGGPATTAAKQATSTIPIVMSSFAGDAVAIGLVASLARPGANVTGLTDESVQLSAKRMELLKEAVPHASVIAVLWNVQDPGMTLRYREIEKAARTLRVDVQALGVREPDDFAGASPSISRPRRHWA